MKKEQNDIIAAQSSSWKTKNNDVAEHVLEYQEPKWYILSPPAIF